jgi:hypothetical protein
LKAQYPSARVVILADQMEPRTIIDLCLWRRHRRMTLRLQAGCPRGRLRSSAASCRDPRTRLSRGTSGSRKRPSRFTSKPF